MSWQHWTWTDIASAVHFGLLHAILFQLVLLPLTMVRGGTTTGRMSALADPAATTWIKPQAMRDYLGCTVLILVGGNMLAFYTANGLLCHRSNSSSTPRCATALRTVWTGYGVLLSTLILAITFWLRSQIASWLVCVLGHLTFAALYVATVAHVMSLAPNHSEGIPSYLCLSAPM
jgi:hypothetical protein